MVNLLNSESFFGAHEMNENKFSFRGVSLRAKEIGIYSCEGCYLSNGHYCAQLRESGEIPPCSSGVRKDGKNVIFVEVKK